MDLEYNLISKILASSELLITSEIEVFKVANSWLNHNNKERSKYAKGLLLKVRLPLLSTETIRHLLLDSKCFEKNDSCVKFLNKILKCKVNDFYKCSSNYHTSRYCNQKYFKLLICGGLNSKTLMACRNVSFIDIHKVRNVEAYPLMKTERISAKVVYLKGDVYVFCGWNINNNWMKSIEKYSLSSKTWNQVAEMNDDREYFCLCAFMDKIFVFGGNEVGGRTSSCLHFDTSDYSLKEVSKMNEARSNAACAVFEEKIIVSGGLDDNYNFLNSVESFDVLPDNWSTMPNMNSGKSEHSLVVVKNFTIVFSFRNYKQLVFNNN